MSRLAAVLWKRPAVKCNVALSDLGSSGRKPAMNRCSRSKCFGATADGICSFLTLPSTLQEIEMRPYRRPVAFFGGHGNGGCGNMEDMAATVEISVPDTLIKALGAAPDELP